MSKIEFGIYERLIDEYLHDVLKKHPSLRTVFGKIDPEEQPGKYSSFVAKILEQALREEGDSEKRLSLCNSLIDHVVKAGNRSHLHKHRLVSKQNPILLEITPPNYGFSGLPRPHTPISESSLFTGSPRDPQLAHELLEEMRSADEVDILVSFIKWSGLRLLMPAFEDMRERNVPVRLITTAYMGASDAPAVEELARMPNVRVRVSYDINRTRLHAKAYHFKRKTGYSTAYIGSANMSSAAMTSGLEWNLKVTDQDMEHILQKFSVEFETYWNSKEFVPFDVEDPTQFRAAIARARKKNEPTSTVFFDIHPHPFQERILEALERERTIHNRWRNLVIAATGTGKTIISALDYKRFYDIKKKRAKLLYVAHREEILQQSLVTYRNVLKNHSFGELLVGSNKAERLEHLFCSVRMLSTRRLWEQIGRNYYDYIVIDEAHHGTAASYRPVIENFNPQILLGLTATPERMDGANVAADFGNRFAAEIRLPEALEEKLLCPFHYFGVADPVAINQDRYWRNGKYDEAALENVYVLDNKLAQQRVEVILSSIAKYEPSWQSIKGVGYCVTIRHAKFMAEEFAKRGVPSAAFVSGLENDESSRLLDEYRAGRLIFLFTVDKLSEGVDVPEINTVLFLRPTESLTVFLQQLGRGLRHAPEKECLTVLDFVGQAHRRYRIDTKLKAILPRHRFSIDKEVEADFPHLPAGCSIQLDRVSRQYVLDNIKENLKRLQIQVPDRLQTFTSETNQELNFSNFIRYHEYEPEVLLVKETWSGWKAKAHLGQKPTDPDLEYLKKGLLKAAFMNGPNEASLLLGVIKEISKGAVGQALTLAGPSKMLLYYRLWGDAGKKLGITSVKDAFSRLGKNKSVLSDLEEILSWSLDTTTVARIVPKLPYACPLELHAQYGPREIQAVFGQANIETIGQTGVGVLHFKKAKTYALLITFQKTEQEFSPSTMYADYPISRELLHWESQSTTSQMSVTGQNLIHHVKRGYTILIFARESKNLNGVTVSFTYLGPAEQVNYEKERPIKMVWKLRYQMPVDMFEDNRKGG